MSDFFSGIYAGIKRPDVVMNDGPLPPQSIGGGYPEVGLFLRCFSVLQRNPRWDR